MPRAAKRQKREADATATVQVRDGQLTPVSQGHLTSPETSPPISGVTHATPGDRNNQGRNFLGVVHDCPFTVVTSFRPNTAGALPGVPSQGQAIYNVQPQSLWNIMERYHKTVVDGVEYNIQDKVVVRTKQCDKTALRIGQIAEIRVLDGFRIYLRIFLIYRPEDLPGGRQPHHGRKEMIATDHMAIVDAQNIVEHESVTHWEEPKSQELPEGLYWRQHYCVLRKELTNLPTICACREPRNPDEIPFICLECRFQMHTSCLIEAEKRKYDGAVDVRLLAPDTDGNQTSVYMFETRDSGGTRISSLREATCLLCSRTLCGSLWEDLLPLEGYPKLS